MVRELELGLSLLPADLENDLRAGPLLGVGVSRQVRVHDLPDDPLAGARSVTFCLE